MWQRVTNALNSASAVAIKVTWISQLLGPLLKLLIWLCFICLRDMGGLVSLRESAFICGNSRRQVTNHCSWLEGEITVAEWTDTSRHLFPSLPRAIASHLHAMFTPQQRLPVSAGQCLQGCWWIVPHSKTFSCYEAPASEVKETQEQLEQKTKEN